ncbi:hypothetical protein VF21_02580 [Pseudogymnoascus sp. 05NY08]|nr:hypothetical protein VF21_02580 [Pseudogymnoascus sp. 05NY08]OBT81071.1 hypothetical protein VE02_10235 [Pseudogymnoascus sp. 03VT05]
MGFDEIEKKVADHYNKDHPQGQGQQAQQPAPPPQPQQQEPPHEDKHHAGNVAKRLGNATVFGAGASVGSNIVNGIIH